MSKTSVPTMDTLNAFIRAACFLRKEAIGRESTAAFLQGNPTKARVLYALDTGLVIANNDPITTGPLDSDGRNGAGYVFPGDDAEKAPQIKLGAALSNFVCYELSPDDLMYQLPGHAEETARVYAAVAQRIEERGRPDYVARSDWEISRVATSVEGLSNDAELVAEVRALAKRLANDGVDEDQGNYVSAIIDRFVEKIVNVYTQFNRAEHEYLNYLRLLVRRGLTPLVDASRAPSTDPDSRALALAFEAAELDKRTFEEVVRHNQLVTLWMARIGSLKSKTNQRRFADDAEALATLDLVNRRFATLTGDTRMVLITRDNHLVEAASRQMAYGENESQGFGANYFSDFGRKYVQHLQAFLSECLVDTNGAFSDAAEDEAGKLPGHVVGWLDAFLGEKAGMSEFDPETLARIAYDDGKADSFAKRLWDQLGKNGDDFKVILEQWHAIRDQASSRELFVEQLKRLEALKEAVRKVLTTILQNDASVLHVNPVEFLATAANAISENLWETFVLSLSQPGARLVVADDSNRSRNPPDIRFDSLKNSAAIVERLIRPNGFSSETELTAAFEQLKKDTLDDIPGNNALGYLYYLMMAAIFAKNSRWSVTYTLVQRAIAIVESHGRRNQVIRVQQPSHISGREAYFVAATAKRLLARSWREFEMAEQYLASARAALDADHEAGSALGQKGRRFQVEQIALDLSRFYWARYNWQETQGLDRGAEMAAAIKRATVTCHRLHQEIQELVGKYRNLRPPTAVNYVTNVAQIAVAYASLGASVPSLPSGYDPTEHLGDVICVLTDLTVEGGTATTTADAGQSAVSRSYLMKAYLVASRLLTGQSVSRREISSLFTDEHMRDHAVTKYDRARFEDLKKFCLERSKG